MKRWMRFFSVVLAFSLLLAGCGQEQEEKDGYYLYAVAGSTIQEEAYQPEAEDADGLMEEFAGLLSSGDGEEKTLLPEGVAVNSCERNDEILYVDMNGAYGQLDPAQEILSRAVLVKTFVQIPEIRYVQITVEGADLTTSQGNAVGLLGADSFLENSGEEINSYRYSDITLYFATEDGQKLVQEDRKVYYISSTPIEQVVVEQLIRGPQEDGHYPTISPNTRIIGVSVSDGIGYVNLDQNFTTGTLTVQEEIPIYSIVNSLIRSGNVKKVQISINGDTGVTFRESMDLDRLYEWNEELIEDENS